MQDSISFASLGFSDLVLISLIQQAYRGAIEKPRKPREKNKTKKVGSKKQRERNRISGRAAKQAGF